MSRAADRSTTLAQHNVPAHATRGPAATVTGPHARLGLVSRLKNCVVATGPRPRHIPFGLLKGLRMELDLRHQTQVYLGLYERELHRWLRTLSRDAVTAIDVGASDGAYTLYFLKRTTARCVYAFEPDPAARHRLLENLRLNGVEGDSRLQVSTSPVGSADGACAVALDTLFSRIELPAVVKVDVEGDELRVLQGARDLFNRGGLSWIIETHSLALERECIDVLESRRLRVRVVAPAWWRIALPEARPIPHNRWLVAYEPRT